MSCDLVTPAFQQYEKQLLAYVRKRLKNKSDSEDLLNQVLLKVYDHCGKIPEVKNVKAWLFKITRNAIYDIWRDRKKELSIEETADISAPEKEASIYRLLEPLVPELIKMLDAEYAKPLYMSDILQKPQQEIADRLGLSLSATKSRIQRARVKLKEMFFRCNYLELDHRGVPVQVVVKEGCGPLQKVAPEALVVDSGQDEKCDC